MYRLTARVEIESERKWVINKITACEIERSTDDLTDTCKLTLPKRSNDSEYGLGGAVWSTDINRCLRVSNALETGRVWVNCYNRLPAGAPFGGYKTSGIGRETHKMMLAAYTQVKNIYISTREEREGMY